jgi:hypothetical protein
MRFVLSVERLKRGRSMDRTTADFLNGLQPTSVFRSFWEFSVKRQDIYLKRLRGEPAPWTDDPILQKFKFTNSFRSIDRTSQYLIKEVIYNPAYPTEPQEYVFRILLFKLFNSILAWEALTAAFGVLTWQAFDFDAYRSVLFDAWTKRGVDIWNAAYRQNQKVHTEFQYRHERYLALLREMMEDRVADKLQRAQTYEQAFNVLKKYPLHKKGFIPMQHLTDINYSPVINFNENDWIIPGPGCLNGMRKCFDNLFLKPPSDWQAQAIINHFVDEQEGYFQGLEYEPVTLFGRKLHAIDIQNVFCETDKYAREAHPDFNLPKNDETGEKYDRIKQNFKVTGPLPSPYFPPKWNLKVVL